jgi:hypothetical protein
MRDETAIGAEPGAGAGEQRLTLHASCSTHPVFDALCVLALASLIALVSARPYAGGWNDGSRLATVECLVDHGTLAIDDSIFVKVPLSTDAAVSGPYPAGNQMLQQYGTLDKLRIHGRYYSDKSPVPALVMAGVYAAWQGLTGLTARERPDRFCLLSTLTCSGLSYVLGVWCIYRLTRRIGLPRALGLALTGSFALSTVALPYVRHVNNHILLLGVAAALVLNLARLQEAWGVERGASLRLLGIGTLAGMAYTIDLGCGPVLVVCMCGLLLYRCRALKPLAIVSAGVLPWVVMHHAVNFAVGGTLQPANSVIEYLQWPGSPFDGDNITGVIRHDWLHFLVYAAALLDGKRGFLGHNLPLFLLLPGFFILLRRRSSVRPEALFAACWCAGTWLLYALASTNASGACCSIRWFVPLLAPGYWVLAILLRQAPEFQRVFLVLSGWGALLGGIMWWFGPWMRHLVPFFWHIQAAALLCWAILAVRRPRPASAPCFSCVPSVVSGQ